MENVTNVNRTAVLGAGSWGTALAHHLCSAGRQVTLWSRDSKTAEVINCSHRNPQYLGDTALHAKLRASSDLSAAVRGTSHVVIAIPSTGYRPLAAELAKHITSDTLVVSTAKGLEDGSYKRLTEILCDELGRTKQIAALSGPSFAAELLKGLPTAVTAAGYEMSAAEATRELFHHDNFRVYTVSDVIGVELGAALKNVYAIAVGIVDGMQMGSNARAAIMTRGLAEMQRLVVGLGGDRLTTVGLSGLGDLILTATGDLSRNRRAGIGLGSGKKLQVVLDEIGQVVEGVGTALKAAELARKTNVEMPIVTGMSRVLRDEISLKDAMKELLSREPRAEF